MTVVLAISVNRMAARRAIVRRLPAVETLGSCTVIGSDKTGTLTQNRMTVESIYAGGRDFEVTGRGYVASGQILADGESVRPTPGTPLYLTLLAGTLCNAARIAEPETDGEFGATGDPTEVALLVAAAKADLGADVLDADLPRIGDIPFDSDRRWAASFHRGAQGTVVLVKGAPESVLDLCTADAGGESLDRERILAVAADMAARGLRVLAMAVGEPDGDESELALSAPRDLQFAGLQGMMDPPREEALAAVAACRRAGTRPLMITGDHAVTALAIARELEVAGPDDRVLTGRDLDALDDLELEEVVSRVPVYARVSPQHKLRIVEALQRAKT